MFDLFYCPLDQNQCCIPVCLCCPVNGSVCFVCWTVFVNCLVKQFAICLGVFVIECDGVVVCVLDTPCMVFHRMCVLCLWSQRASRCSFHMCVCVFVCRMLSHLGV